VRSATPPTTPPTEASTAPFIAPFMRGLLLAAALVAAASAVVAPSFDGGLLWDDAPLVTANPLVTQPGGLADIWWSGRASDYYPLTWTSLRAQHALFGDDPRGYRLVNALLHGLVGVVLWRVLARLAVPGAYVAALAFVVHPLTVATSAWISEQKNTLATLLAGLALVVWLRGRRRATAGATALFAAAMLAKLSVVLLPGVALLCARRRDGRIGRGALRASLPLVAVALSIGAVAVAVQHGHAVPGVAAEQRGLPERLATAGWALGTTLRHMLVPVDLTMVYPAGAAGAVGGTGATGATGAGGSAGAAVGAWLPGALLVLALAVAWPRTGAVARGFAAAAGSYVLLLLPTVGLVEIRYSLLPAVADHYGYAALAPVVAAVVAAGARAVARLPDGVARRAAAAAAAGLLVVPLALASHARAGLFVDQATLFRDNVARRPGAWLAHDTLGVALLARGGPADLERAAVHFERAAALNPRYAVAWNNLGTLRARQGRPDLAEAALRRALAI
jgi:hypothetical protein